LTSNCGGWTAGRFLEVGNRLFGLLRTEQRIAGERVQLRGARFNGIVTIQTGTPIIIGGPTGRSRPASFLASPQADLSIAYHQTRRIHVPIIPD
jgi:hypothetical protein